jgi:hypothetical protein
MPQRAEDPVLVNSRREAAIVLVIWATACTYTVGYCAAFGYDREPSSLRFVFGIPDWVFWGIVVPWATCSVLSFWVANFVIRDDDLGAEQPEAQLEEQLDREADHA